MTHVFGFEDRHLAFQLEAIDADVHLQTCKDATNGTIYGPESADDSEDLQLVSYLHVSHHRVHKCPGAGRSILLSCTFSRFCYPFFTIRPTSVEKISGELPLKDLRHNTFYRAFSIHVKFVFDVDSVFKYANFVTWRGWNIGFHWSQALSRRAGAARSLTALVGIHVGLSRRAQSGRAQYLSICLHQGVLCGQQTVQTERYTDNHSGESQTQRHFQVEIIAADVGACYCCRAQWQHWSHSCTPISIRRLIHALQAFWRNIASVKPHARDTSNSSQNNSK